MLKFNAYRVNRVVSEILNRVHQGRLEKVANRRLDVFFRVVDNVWMVLKHDEDRGPEMGVHLLDGVRGITTSSTRTS